MNIDLFVMGWFVIIFNFLSKNPVGVWTLCAVINLAVLTFSCIDVFKSVGQLNKSGVTFAVFWFIVLAPPVTFCMVLYWLIGLKEKWSERDSSRKVS